MPELPKFHHSPRTKQYQENFDSIFKKDKVKPVVKPAAVNSEKIVKQLRQIVETTIVPKEEKGPVLVTPLPKKDVANFGDIPFESQAHMIFNTFPATDAEIIGTTAKSGPKDAQIPGVAGAS